MRRACQTTSYPRQPFTRRIEISNTTRKTDPDRACQLLSVLHAMGVRISIDDYGTGYSSLSYLRDLPIDEIKIGRSFVTALTNNPRNGAIVGSTIELAHALGLGVVAEGVEDESTIERLRALGCDRAQGF